MASLSLLGQVPALPSTFPRTFKDAVFDAVTGNFFSDFPIDFFGQRRATNSELLWLYNVRKNVNLLDLQGPRLWNGHGCEQWEQYLEAQLVARPDEAEEMRNFCDYYRRQQRQQSAPTVCLHQVCPLPPPRPVVAPAPLVQPTTLHSAPSTTSAPHQGPSQTQVNNSRDTSKTSPKSQTRRIAEPKSVKPASDVKDARQSERSNKVFESSPANDIASALLANTTEEFGLRPRKRTQMSTCASNNTAHLNKSQDCRQKSSMAPPPAPRKRPIGFSEHSTQSSTRGTKRPLDIDTGDNSSTKQPATKVIKTDTEQTKKGSAWSAEEMDLCERIMADIHANKPGMPTEHKWIEVSKQMIAAGYDRHPGGIRSYWSRHLRERSNLDERKKPRPEAMRTATLDGKRVGRYSNKGSTQQEAIDLTTPVTPRYSAPDSKLSSVNQPIDLTSPATPAVSASASKDASANQPIDLTSPSTPAVAASRAKVSAVTEQAQQPSTFQSSGAIDLTEDSVDGQDDDDELDDEMDVGRDDESNEGNFEDGDFDDGDFDDADYMSEDYE